MVFCNLGKTEVSKWLGGESAVAPTHFAFGTDSTTPNVTDSSLGGEVFRDTFDSQTRTNTINKFEGVLSTIEATGSTLTEIAILNSSSGGIMYTRNTFASIEKTDQVEIQSESREIVL